MTAVRGSGFDPRLMVSLVALGEELHFGRAAARLGISQPTLSRQIARLEDQLGTELVVRGAGGISLTRDGARFLSACREIVERAAQAQAGLSEPGGRLSIHLGDGVHPIVRHIAATFYDAHPHVEVAVEEGAPSAAIRAVLSGEADIGFDVADGMTPELAYVPIETAPVGLACAVTHPLTGVTGAGWQDLAGERIILAPPGVADGWNRFVLSVLHRLSVECELVTAPHVTKAAYLAAFIAEGHGSLPCASFTFDPLPPGVTWIALEPTIRKELGLHWNPDTASDNARRFVAWAQATAASSPSS